MNAYQLIGMIITLFISIIVQIKTRVFLSAEFYKLFTIQNQFSHLLNINIEKTITYSWSIECFRRDWNMILIEAARVIVY